MAIKKLNKLVYWIEGRSHIIGELSDDEYLGWYSIKRFVSLLSATEIINFEISTVGKVHKNVIKEIPDWLTKKIFKGIFD